MGLGDAVHEALALAGVTPERVEAWLGRPCGCEERQLKLNMLGQWASRTVKKVFLDAPLRLAKMLES